jgi:hypothetical protein
MEYKLKCRCGATCWVRGSYDPETNATELDEKATREWEGGDTECDHQEDEIIAEQDIFIED